jgi:nucleoid-associated protein YgaU
LDTPEPPALPPVDISPANDKKPATEGDPFKAPGELQSTVTERKEKSVSNDTGPVIRIGAIGQDSPPKKEKDPKIDLDSKAPPKASDPPALPDIPTIDLDAKPTNKDGKPPGIGPTPVSDPPLPAIKIPGGEDVPPPPPAPMKSPMNSDVPPSPAIKIDLSPKIDVPPPPAGARTDKKEDYDEDWHTRRDGDTYVLISKEYYKTADYARALEAYNKDRFKANEGIIRVPPPWVLEEQFPNLVGAKPEKPPEPKVKDNVKFEAAEPKAGGRTAPPPSLGSNDEYRVKAEAGESIRDIARKVYGNEDAWKKLWELNPDLDPTRLIPNGTALRLGR